MNEKGPGPATPSDLRVFPYSFPPEDTYMLHPRNRAGKEKETEMLQRWYPLPVWRYQSLLSIHDRDLIMSDCVCHWRKMNTRKGLLIFCNPLARIFPSYVL